MRTLIIAEAGVNHNGNLSLACKLVDAAAAAGADFVKFQTFSADRLVTVNAAKADYQTKAIGNGESQYEMIRGLELSLDMHKDLIAHSMLRKIRFLSSGFDSQSVDMLMELDLEYIKVPSGEITDLPYLRHIGRLAKRVILSTGMSTMDEIATALEVLKKAGTDADNITVLHCNTEYPTPMTDVNLRAMLTIRDELGVAVGYSDHTLGIEAAVAAVALGATIIEKHLTLNRTMPGPDHRASLEPEQFKGMVTAIRNIELAMGDGVKRPSASEAKNIPISRKSLVAACSIRKGELFSEANLAVKRPGIGISPMRWDDMMGKTAMRDYERDELIEP